jgi:hypothetical protein
MHEVSPGSRIPSWWVRCAWTLPGCAFDDERSSYLVVLDRYDQLTSHLHAYSVWH